MRSPARRRAELGAAWVLGLCAAVVAFWQVMAAVTSRPRAGLELTASRFEGFTIDSAEWSAQRLPVPFDPLEPNIVALELSVRRPALAIERHPIFVRLVHGYNMCDCMRIKGYTVEPLADTRRPATAAPGAPAPEPALGLPAGLQVWSLTSPTGDRGLWVTTMLRASDFTATDIDVRDMAFPRVGTPDAQGWAPRGLTLRSLRHPVRNLRTFLRAKWNASRCDWLTFLRLRQPAWVSDEVLTLVSATRGSGIPESEVPDGIRHVVRAHMETRAALQQWSEARLAPGASTIR